MQNNELSVYIKSERARGVSDQSLYTELVKQGWTIQDAEEALWGISHKKSTTFRGFNVENLCYGRITRLQFLMCIAVAPLLNFVIIVIFAVFVELYYEDPGRQDLVYNLIAVLAVSIFLYWTSAISRRLHDLGYSGYYSLVIFISFFIPIVGNIVTILFLTYLILKRGQLTVNDYGEVPCPERPIINVLLNTN